MIAKKLSDNPPASTLIYVNDDTTGRSSRFFKNDVGNFPKGVVLDLTKNGWATFGHSFSKGYFKGQYFHS
ncbi:hypothetical protein DVV81_11515 [Clostridium botulinum]|uniref:hypothetical protein n=1 Tax=Clostridium botulinum TaxID=1491 RepID=UPI0019673BD7|nr:hypothetical protein [Clostridium botulinum]MBN1059218.1 hypothetical protein [Clostridium botulinum]MBN1062419.1 hypothetical protein [Clostridium botulinum]MBN1071789.1 hypothetical protein [Clostridium botulinum]